MLFPALTVQLRSLTPLGAVRLAASPQGLCGLWFEGQRHEPAVHFSGPQAWPMAADDHPVLRAAERELLRQLQQTTCAPSATAAPPSFDFPLDLSGGTAFQQGVWQALLQIPRGATTSYGALSRLLGRPQAVRAVGAAVGRNPISVLVPCHRVLGADGSLTGYAGGLERKVALLGMERACIGCKAADARTADLARASGVLSASTAQLPFV